MTVQVESKDKSYSSYDILNNLKTQNKQVQINFTDGKSLIGKIVSFDKSTIQLLGKNGINLAFKSWITSISEIEIPVKIPKPIQIPPIPPIPNVKVQVCR